MRFGCCGSMISPRRDPIGIEIVEDLAALGFDYIELSIRDLAVLPEPDFAKILKRIQDSGIRCEACNNFFPAQVRLTGPDSSLHAAIEYATWALGRAAQLGASVVVFGSADARNIPPGFAYLDAWHQIVEMLQSLGPVAGNLGITIAIEPLNTREANLVRTAKEGLKLAREVGDAHVQLLIDYYHLRQEKEDPSIVLEAANAIQHLHFAQPTARGFPMEANSDYDKFFSNLRQIGYGRRCSIEAYSQDFVSDARRALTIMRTINVEDRTASELSQTC